MGPPNDSREPASKRCLACPGRGGAHFRLLYTRRSIGGRILRRRECRHCGRRVTTYSDCTYACSVIDRERNW